jgi:hypothetical protein
MRSGHHRSSRFDLTRTAVISHGARHLPGFAFGLSELLFNSLDLNALAFYVKPEPAEEAHILVGDPDQRKAANQVPTPIVIQQLVTCNDQENNGDIVAETVFTREQIKELTAVGVPAGLSLPNAVIPRLAENLFMRHSPGNTSNGDGDKEQCDDLGAEGHLDKDGCWRQQVAWREALVGRPDIGSKTWHATFPRLKAFQPAAAGQMLRMGFVSSFASTGALMR